MIEPLFRGRHLASAATALVMLGATLATAGCGDEIFRVAARPWSPSDGTGAAAGSGGEGQGGSTGGQGGAAGAGGSASTVECLDSSFYAEVLDLGQAGLCLVARYSAALEIGYTRSPTWGLHGGPLTAAYEHVPNGEVIISRWLVPNEPLGTLAQQTARIRLDITADPVFFGAQVVDLPFYWWTLLSWTGNWGTTEGEIILLLDDTIAERRPAVGTFGAVGLGQPFAPGRIVHSGLTAMGDAAGSQASGLYGAEYCMGPPPIPCGTGAIATWGEASGPVAKDAQSNVFALQTWYSTGLQSLRGFEATTLSPHAPPTEGDVLLTMPGFGSELAAIAPAAGQPGMVLFQPYDSNTYQPLDIIALPYAVSHTTVEPAGEVSVAFSMITPGTPVTLMTDLDGRAWVGVQTSEGTATFYVLDRDPDG
ncbi:MAG: hypothetical protein JRI23_05460 [Deltaproteobacteria bacterium]|jgi:hypothetical protein|nr:hypothetical protein [Deltaproteobacteria bacterium]MBW2531000.1 hypothetical protein [Deltaproteobacteria bacterium]